MVRFWYILRWNQQDFLTGWVWSASGREESRATPGILARAIRSMDLALTEMEKTEGDAVCFVFVLEGVKLGVQF